MQRHSSKQQEENDFYKKELESLKQQLELKSKELTTSLVPTYQQ